MGKAVVDLPDPLQKPAANASPASAASADDLLSQMAGDEIDRLLAEADVERPPKPAANGASGAPASSASAAAAHAPTASQQKQAALAAEAEEALGAELDSLFAELQKDPAGPLASATASAVAEAASLPPPPPPAPPVAAPPSAERADDEPAAPAEAPPPSAEVTAGSGEKAALLAAAGFDTEEDPHASPTEADDADIVVGGAGAARVPFYLKPLVWLNAPFAGCPESMRNVLGKVGILTLFNAVAVIAYVVIVRKHH